MNVVRFLLESGASIVGNGNHGKSALLYAVQWKEQNLIRLMLEYGADINVKDEDNGFTPLMIAAKFNDRRLCEFLLARDADKSLKNSSGKSAAELALDDQCWGSLLAIDETLIPSKFLPLAKASQPKNLWGRYSLSNP